MVGSSRRLFTVFVFMLVCSLSSWIVVDGYKLKCHEQQNATEYAAGKCVLVHSSADDLKWNAAEEKCSKLSDDDHVWSLPESMSITDDQGKALREEMEKFYSDDAVGTQRVFVYWWNRTHANATSGVMCDIAIWKWFETKNSSDAFEKLGLCVYTLSANAKFYDLDTALASNFVLVCESRLRNENPINGSDPVQVDEVTEPPAASDNSDNSTVWLVLGICLGVMLICTVLTVALLVVRRRRKNRELTTLRAVNSQKSTGQSSIEGSDKKMLKSKKTTPIVTKGVAADKVDGSKQPESSPLSSSKKSNQGSKMQQPTVVTSSKKSADARQDGGKSLMGSKKVEVTKKVMISGK